MLLYVRKTKKQMFYKVIQNESDFCCCLNIITTTYLGFDVIISQLLQHFDPYCLKIYCTTYYPTNKNKTESKQLLQSAVMDAAWIHLSVAESQRSQPLVSSPEL